MNYNAYIKNREADGDAQQAFDVITGGAQADITEAWQTRQAIDHAGDCLTDEQAVESIAMFRPWKPDEHIFVGDKRRDSNYLYRARQEHTSQAIYPPSLVPALWERIEKPGEGTHDNPINYDAAVGMALINGLFYAEDGILYQCIRDTGVPVYNRLADLVNIYVMVSNA